jgi:hypothetical protein
VKEEPAWRKVEMGSIGLADVSGQTKDELVEWADAYKG